MRLRALVLSLFVAVLGMALNLETVLAAKAIEDGPMQVVIVRGSDPACEPLCPQWIDAEGTIETNTPALFREVFRKMGSQKLPIIIRSPGGSIEASLIIGKMVRERGLTVAVGFTQFTSCSPVDENCKLASDYRAVYDGRIVEEGAFCNSACPMILAAGVTRLAAAKADVGLHEPRTEWTVEVPNFEEFEETLPGTTKKIKSKKQVGSKTVIDKVTFGLHKELRQSLTTYYRDMGIDTAILKDMTKAKNADMHYISEARKDALKIRTDKNSALSLGEPQVCGSAAGQTHCVLDTSRDPALKTAMQEQKLGFLPNEKEMTFRLVRLALADCASSCPAWIAADGVITRKTPDALIDIVAQAGNSKLPVIFNSSGGDVRAAAELGSLLRQMRIETSIAKTTLLGDIKLAPKKSMAKFSAGTLTSPGRCIGACVLAFVGGSKSHAPKLATVQMHNPKLYEAAVGPQSKTDIFTKHLRRMGAAGGLNDELLQLPVAEEKSLSQSDLMKHAIASDAEDISDILSVDKCRAYAEAVGCVSIATAPVEGG